MNSASRAFFVTYVIGPCVVAAIIASQCLSAAPQKLKSPALTGLPVNPALIDVVTRYIEKTRGWNKDQYTVSLRHKDGKLWHFWVYFNGARMPGLVGNDGKSFDAVLNTDTNRIEKELHFQ
jgi:hypothetical protein